MDRLTLNTGVMMLKIHCHHRKKHLFLIVLIFIFINNIISNIFDEISATLVRIRDF